MNVIVYYYYKSNILFPIHHTYVTILEMVHVFDAIVLHVFLTCCVVYIYKQCRLDCFVGVIGICFGIYSIDV